VSWREPLLLLALAGCVSADPVPREPADEAWGQTPLPQAACVGDGDGVFERNEVVLAADAGVEVAYLVNAPGSEVAVPEPGGRQVDGAWVFELAPAPADSDAVLILGPRPLAGHWLEASFPGGEFVASLDAAAGLLGIYRLASDGLYLQGIASEEEGPTVLAYAPEVLVLPTPMAVGDSWAVEAAAEGVVDGDTYPADLGPDGVVSLVHRWSFDVDAFGTAVLPAGPLDVLRQRSVLQAEAHNSAAGLVASDVQRADVYVAECVGVVARARSRIDEPDVDFAVATELLRFGLDPELRP